MNFICTHFFRLALVSLSLISLFIGSGNAIADYTIPDDLTPVNAWRFGYSADEALEFRRAYTYQDFVDTGDTGTYMFSRLGELIPTATLYRRGPVANFLRKPMPEIADVTATTQLGENMTLSEAMEDERSRMRAIAVVHNGKLVFERYIGIRPRDSHLWQSCSKTLSSLLIHMLAEEGKISLDAPVTDYLEELADTGWAQVTVADVLHQKSGMNVEEDNVSNPEHPVAQFYKSALSARGEPSGTPQDEILREIDVLQDPGEAFQYGSINTQILGLLIERVTGKPWNDVASRRVWGKIGMEGDGKVAITSTGELLNGGVIAGRLRDFARYGTIYTPSWDVVTTGIKPIVSDSYFDKVYAAADKDIFDRGYMGQRMLENFGPLEMGASYQWDAVFPDGDLYKSGRSGQALYVSPETDTVVVWFSTTWKSSLWLEGYAREIVTQIFRDAPFPLPDR
ncbi:MAG: beta-lactamase family protein [Cyanobacteria bacterium SBLK]|nr:beta-lactamase family protein [Cyanobacteria bacterium SBLK]